MVIQYLNNEKRLNNEKTFQGLPIEVEECSILMKEIFERTARTSLSSRSSQSDHSILVTWCEYQSTIV